MYSLTFCFIQVIFVGSEKNMEREGKWKPRECNTNTSIESPDLVSLSRLHPRLFIGSSTKTLNNIWSESENFGASNKIYSFLDVGLYHCFSVRAYCISCFVKILWWMPVRNDHSRTRAVPVIPKDVASRSSKISWSTVSNAADMSRRPSKVT